jgi:hypothetical protein
MSNYEPLEKKVSDMTNCVRFFSLIIANNVHIGDYDKIYKLG